MHQLQRVSIGSFQVELLWSTRMHTTASKVVGHRIQLSLHLIKTFDDITAAVERILSNPNTQVSSNGLLYVKGKQIGSGGFSSVYACLNKKSVVLKFATNARVFKREISIYEHLVGSDGLIPTYYGCTADQCLIIERFERDLTGAPTLSNDSCNTVATSIIDCLRYLHGVGYVHCDVKPANILVDKNNRAVLSDFGLTRTYRSEPYNLQPLDHRVGTEMYMSRDIHNHVRPTRRSDLESLGWTLVEVYGGRLPWKGCVNGTTGVQKQPADYKEFLVKCFEPKSYPPQLLGYLCRVAELDYNEVPDYALLKSYFSNQIQD